MSCQLTSIMMSYLYIYQLPLNIYTYLNQLIVTIKLI